jgi:hypothetical protein
MKAVHRRNRKQELRGQHDVEVPFTKVITDVTGAPLGEEMAVRLKATRIKQR